MYIIPWVPVLFLLGNGGAALFPLSFGALESDFAYSVGISAFKRKLFIVFEQSIQSMAS